MKNTRVIKLRYGQMLQCTDPENCDLEHNEIPGWDADDDRLHHCGCDCDACLEFYRTRD